MSDPRAHPGQTAMSDLCEGEIALPPSDGYPPPCYMQRCTSCGEGFLASKKKSHCPECSGETRTTRVMVLAEVDGKWRVACGEAINESPQGVFEKIRKARVKIEDVGVGPTKENWSSLRAAIVGGFSFMRQPPRGSQYRDERGRKRWEGWKP